jgi:hypothetical protein
MRSAVKGREIGAASAGGAPSEALELQAPALRAAAVARSARRASPPARRGWDRISTETWMRF